jgi:hypothetical protein
MLHTNKLMDVVQARGYKYIHAICQAPRIHNLGIGC